MKNSRWAIQPPLLIKLFYPNVLWREKTKDKIVFLTFDDGPIPQVTPWVIDELNKYNIKATFFCVADNVRKHPKVFDLLTNNGMSIGNHTFSHKPVSKIGIDAYIKDIQKGKEYINSNLFRPPHGIIYPWHVKRIRKYFTKIVCWDVLTVDYSKDLSANNVFDNVKKFVRPGSVIVFHDSLKAWDRLKDALPMTIEYLKNEGYSFEIIKE